jgi:hypothetical protein
MPRDAIYGLLVKYVATKVNITDRHSPDAYADR